MKRAFNYTGRVDLPNNLISIHLKEGVNGAPPSFIAQLGDLMSLGLPGHAAVYVEPYVGGSSAMRFSFGTLNDLVTPASTAMDELDSGDRILFNLKIVDETSTVGKVLASCRGISPRHHADIDGAEPLLPLRPADLEEELWRLSDTEPSGPEVVVNNRVPGLADQLKTNPLVQGLVIPSALRSIVPTLFTDDPPSWAANWRVLCQSLVGEPVDWELDTDVDDEEVQQIVDVVVRRFLANQKYASRLITVEGGMDA